MYFSKYLCWFIMEVIHNGGMIMEHLAILSLLALVVTIVLGFACNKNTGILAIAFALLLSRLAGTGDKSVIAGFSSSLFVTLFGITFLFGIAQENRTLELLAKKIVALCGKRQALLPFALFLLAAVIAAIGPGPISTSALMSVLAVSLALELDIAPIKLLPFGSFGSFAGGLSALTPSGIVAMAQAEKAGHTDLAAPLLICTFCAMLLYCLVLYFFVFKWHKYTPDPDKKLTGSTEKFNRDQLITLAGIGIMAALTLVFEINVGLAAFAVGAVLSLLGVASEEKAIKSVSLGSLIMICGVGMLIEQMLALGGIQLLSDTLSRFTTPKLAAATMTLLGGVLSWFSSASGVVMPTLIPTVPGIAAAVGANEVGMIIGICIGAHAAATSPLSSCGAMSLAAFSSMTGADEQQRSKMFARLFYISIGGVAFVTVLGGLGLYGLL